MSSAFVDLAGPELIARYEPVIGLEVHVQLATATKIFCGCPTSFGAQPNSNVCPVCLGLPGALPVLNRAAVELAIQAALALNCRVRPVSRFARKNYFYPDLPKGYQISQYEEPLAEHGWVEIPVDGAPKRIGVTRVHMEDDAGKSIHDGFRDSDRYTYVDLNRSGTPLIEIVTEPDMRGSQEAYDFLTGLKQTLEFLNVSTCDMEKGHLRCDANVSVRLKGAERFGTKAEVKNLNSFRFLKLALDYEIARQVAILESGGAVPQETRLFNPDTGETAGMRSKEHAHDYRYFPEPDLAPLRVADAWLDEIRVAHAGTARPQARPLHGKLRPEPLRRRCAHRQPRDRGVFRKAAAAAGDPKAAANWVMGDLMGALNAAGRRDRGFARRRPSGWANWWPSSGRARFPVRSPKRSSPKCSRAATRRRHHRERRPAADQRYRRAGTDRRSTCCNRMPKQVEQYKSGKTTVLGFLVGQVMKASRGQANPGVVNDLLKKKLC